MKEVTHMRVNTLQFSTFLRLFFLNLAITADVPDFIHHGCFVDYTTSLLNKRLPYDKDNSNDKCVYRCYQEGYEVAGTEYGYECFCGDGDNFKDGTAVRAANETECSTACAGDSKQKCGGIWRQTVTVINRHAV